VNAPSYCPRWSAGFGRAIRIVNHFATSDRFAC
jgi:hypothetical protein